MTRLSVWIQSETCAGGAVDLRYKCAGGNMICADSRKSFAASDQMKGNFVNLIALGQALPRSGR
jgi:hypothetical protein